jgi:hypothetical protein
MNPKNTLAVTLAAFGMAALVGCDTPQALPPQATQIQCVVPTLTALDETKEAQTKGGLEIAVVPALFKAVRVDKTTVTAVQPDTGTQIGMGITFGLSGDTKNKVYVEKVTTPDLKVVPRRLEFTVRINNKLDRVFRGQGAVVQFNVGGKLVPFGSTDYKEFIGGIVPPRNESEFKIYGPALNSIPDKGTIGIFLYDVITATDVAGNTTEKQNYEWYFNYTTQTATETADVKKWRGFIDIVEYQQSQAQVMREQILQERQVQQ